ncbi:MAG TPA: sensor histidine kinase [Arenimonas sp.]|uniref:sensor histidine kinase n=1 Tax=Arenimonas sp. TaxID=1872635 RepID=UPI002BD70B3E|nr:sensor histidine kinase [Arenimonas sp.]HMB57397.1 sensor histidine kinase [Arenimonas sp.]
MPLRLSHTQLLRYAGLFTWAVVGIPLVFNTLYFPVGEVDEALGPPDMVGSTIAYFVFGVAYWLVTRELGQRRPRWYDILLLGALTVSAIAVSKLTHTGLGSILLMLVSGVIPWLMPLSVGVAWLVLQHVALVPVFERMGGFTPMAAVLQAALYIGYSSFTFITGLVAKQQAQAREDQRRLNSELRATRALLAESSRMSERLRISRELHDLLGHHLTALSLNLEVAGHLTEGKAQDHVKQSHTLAKLLLTDVREAVSEMREERGIDLGVALRTLVEGVPALEVILNIPDRLQLEDPERAQVMLRCAQEIITNAVRHAGANHLWLRVELEPGMIHLNARDDGRGGEHPKPGNGLSGMRERLAAYGGRADIITAPGQGFALNICLPLEISP